MTWFRAKSKPTPSHQELEMRRQAWAALSELFLDTDHDLPGVFRSLKATGLPRTELIRIMQADVAPVIGVNLLSVAGVWQGFDLTPIEQRYLAGRAFPTLQGWYFLLLIRKEWNEVLDGLPDT